MQEKPDKLVPALIGGVVIGVISGVPGLNLVNCFCCAGIIGGGIVAVYLYNRNIAKGGELTYADGTLLGIVAGIFGAIIGTLIEAGLGVSFNEVVQQMLEYSEELPPEVEDVLRLLQERQAESTTLFFMIGLAFEMMLDALFGLLGGILGVAIFRKKKVG